MAQLNESVVTFRIFGDDLVPHEITKLLGAEPTIAEINGQERYGNKTGRVWIARSGMWQLTAKDRKPEDINGQVQEILSRMTDDLSVWRTIADRYEIDLFCGLFMLESNEGLTISAATLAALGLRGIEVNLDIYDNGPDGDSDQRSIRNA